MSHGYSGKPLFKKLGMKPWSIWRVVNAPADYSVLLGPVEAVTFTNSEKDLDGIHWFAKSTEDVEKALVDGREMIKRNGMIWVSWYKKSARIPTDVTEDVIRDTALHIGLVDVKVCAVDDKWSALKIVWRKENR